MEQRTRISNGALLIVPTTISTSPGHSLINMEVQIRMIAASSCFQNLLTAVKHGVIHIGSANLLVIVSIATIPWKVLFLQSDQMVKYMLHGPGRKELSSTNRLTREVHGGNRNWLLIPCQEDGIMTLVVYRGAM